MLKVNIAGSFFAADNTGGWGFIVRDENGEVRGAGAGRLQYVASAACAEAQACSAALLQAASWGMTRVIVESDAQSRVRAAKSSDFDLAPV
jgi:ribonuclease HI